MFWTVMQMFLKLYKWIEDTFFGGPLFLNRMAKYFRELIYEGNVTVYGILSVCFYMFMVWGVPSLLPHDNVVVSAMSTVVWTVLLILSFYDLNVLEAFFVGYKKSDYYLATGNRRRDIWTNKGLQGEFMAYVLSRELKIEHRTLYNVCVPMENGNFQEVDAVIITGNMIYVLECKNRAGSFVGTYEDATWKQYIGRAVNECSNIYIQNQKHTMAIDQLLLKKGIIENGESVCMNCVVCAGIAAFPGDNVPSDFVFGMRRDMVKIIQDAEKLISSANDGGSEGIMQEIYELLLPYALYTNEERETMMQTRDRIAKNSHEFSVGSFQVVHVPQGIQGVSDDGEEVIIRRNRIYTQILLMDGSRSFWQTRTDIPSRYFN